MNRKMGGGKRSRDASSSSCSRSPEPGSCSRSASSFYSQRDDHKRSGLSRPEDERRRLLNDSGDLSGWVQKSREDDQNECSLSQNRQALLGPSSDTDPVLGYTFFDVQNKSDIPTQELGKDIMEEEPPEIRISSPVMPKPAKREEYSSAADSARDKLCMNLKRALAAAADTEEWLAKETQRKYAMRNLTVESTFCDVDDGSTRSYKARKVAVLASQFVVSLSSFSDERRIRVCSGIVIASDGCTETCKILTSATLVTSPSGCNSVVPNVKVKVCLPNGNISDGSIYMVDFHYNIAMIEVKGVQNLSEAILIPRVVKRGAVLAMGRFYDDATLMCSQGKIRKQASRFDCSELSMSSCKTTMAGIGEPLVNYSGHVLGINFYEEKHTPFLSTAVVLRCLEHWENYHKIIRPWLGFKYISLDMVPLKVLEKCPCVDKGLYISNVTEGSPADVAGLCVGDILIECAGESISTAPKFGALLLDISNEHIETHSSNRKITLEFVVRKQGDDRKLRKILLANYLTELNYYRWPVPIPSYNHNIIGGRTISDFYRGNKILRACHNRAMNPSPLVPFTPLYGASTVT